MMRKIFAKLGKPSIEKGVMTYEYATWDLDVAPHLGDGVPLELKRVTRKVTLENSVLKWRNYTMSIVSENDYLSPRVADINAMSKAVLTPQDLIKRLELFKKILSQKNSLQWVHPADSAELLKMYRALCRMTPEEVPVVMGAHPSYPCLLHTLCWACNITGPLRGYTGWQ